MNKTDTEQLGDKVSDFVITYKTSDLPSNIRGEDFGQIIDLVLKATPICNVQHRAISYWGDDYD